MNGIAAYANQDMVPPGAIANIRGAADMLERFGREGDIYVVHAAEGETVVPMEVLNSSPNLKKMLFSQMEEMGLKPERYVVGNELNSLNPVTGKPEFFFKKLFKSIKGIFKKAAPILGAIAGTFLAGPLGAAIGGPLGPIIGSAAGAGIGSFAASKITGASTRDALRGAAFSAGTAGILRGFADFTKIGQNFSKGLDDLTGNVIGDSQEGLTGFFENLLSGPPTNLAPSLAASPFDPVVPLNRLPSPQIGSGTMVTIPPDVIKPPPLFQGSPIKTSQGNLFARNDFKPGSLGFSISDIAEEVGKGAPSELTALEGPLLTSKAAQGFFGTTPVTKTSLPSVISAEGAQPTVFGNVGTNALPLKSTTNLALPLKSTTNLPESLVDTYTFTQQPLRPTLVSDQLGSGRQALQTGDVRLGINQFQPDVAGTNQSVSPIADRSILERIKNVDIAGIPGHIAEFVTDAAKEQFEKNKLGLLAGGALGAANFLEAQAQQEAEKEAEERRLSRNRRISTAFDQGRNRFNFAGVNPDFQPRPVFAKKGGKIPSKGLGDIVPAMLEPGEFVMTRSAVTGAGNGSQKDGIKRMYSMMKDFEGRV
jgi:hypothetical protein